MKSATSLAFNVLIKEEDGAWLAHCLELDIVATGDTIQAAEQDLVDLIRAQVSYAIEHDNLDHLYHAAPPEIWKEFFECDDRWERRHKSARKIKVTNSPVTLPPFEIIANTCRSVRACRA